VCRRSKSRRAWGTLCVAKPFDIGRLNRIGQSLLEMEDAKARLERLYEMLQAEIEILQVEKKISLRVTRRWEKTAEEYIPQTTNAGHRGMGAAAGRFKNELRRSEEKLSPSG